MPTLSVQGVIKHVIGPVNAGAGAPPLCLQAYFIEGEDENPYNNSDEDRALLTLIRQSINAINPMIQNLKQHISQLQTYNNIPRYRIVLGEEAPEGQNPQLFLLPTLRELSAIIIDPDINIDIKYYNSRREIVLESHGGNLQTLKSNSPLYDPMSYTLLFPYGDLGWTYNIIQNGKKVTEQKYYANRLHFRDGYGPIDFDTIFHQGLISHQYFIDCWVKTEESKLFYLSTHQQQLRSELYQGMLQLYIKLLSYIVNN